MIDSQIQEITDWVSRKEGGGLTGQNFNLIPYQNLLWHKNGCRYPIKINGLETSNAHVLRFITHHKPSRVKTTKVATQLNNFQPHVHILS